AMSSVVLPVPAAASTSSDSSSDERMRSRAAASAGAAPASPAVTPVAAPASVAACTSPLTRTSSLVFPDLAQWLQLGRLLPRDARLLPRPAYRAVVAARARSLARRGREEAVGERALE